MASDNMSTKIHHENQVLSTVRDMIHQTIQIIDQQYAPGIQRVQQEDNLVIGTGRNPHRSAYAAFCQERDDEIQPLQQANPIPYAMRVDTLSHRYRLTRHPLPLSLTTADRAMPYEPQWRGLYNWRESRVADADYHRIDTLEHERIIARWMFQYDTQHRPSAAPAIVQMSSPDDQTQLTQILQASGHVPVLQDIVPTIQKEQYRIIASPKLRLIVEGLAGSGKTEVVLHRLAWLAYDLRVAYHDTPTPPQAYWHRHPVNPSQFLFLTSSPALQNYVLNILPALDGDGQLFPQLSVGQWLMEIIRRWDSFLHFAGSTIRSAEQALFDPTLWDSFDSRWHPINQAIMRYRQTTQEQLLQTIGSTIDHYVREQRAQGKASRFQFVGLTQRWTAIMQEAVTQLEASSILPYAFHTTLRTFLDARLTHLCRYGDLWFDSEPEVITEARAITNRWLQNTLIRPSIAQFVRSAENLFPSFHSKALTAADLLGLAYASLHFVAPSVYAAIGVDEAHRLPPAFYRILALFTHRYTFLTLAGDPYQQWQMSQTATQVWEHIFTAWSSPTSLQKVQYRTIHFSYRLSQAPTLLANTFLRHHSPNAPSLQAVRQDTGQVLFVPESEAIEATLHLLQQTAQDLLKTAPRVAILIDDETQWDHVRRAFPMAVLEPDHLPETGWIVGRAEYSEGLEFPAVVFWWHLAAFYGQSPTLARKWYLLTSRARDHITVIYPPCAASWIVNGQLQ